MYGDVSCAFRRRASQVHRDHVATFLVVVYALLEGAVVKYVVPGALLSSIELGCSILAVT